MGGSVKVECHAGYSYPERPTAFEWQGQKVEVAAIISEARTPHTKRFHVKSKDGMAFELIYNESLDEWKISESQLVL